MWKIELILMLTVITIYGTTDVAGDEACLNNGFNIDDKCYLVVWGPRKLENAKATCKRKGYDHLAFVEDERTHDALVATLRKLIRDDPARRDRWRSPDFAWFWLGRTVDPETKEETFFDGRRAEWTKWWPKQPTAGIDETAVFWGIRTDPSDRHQGFWNTYPEQNGGAALCQLGLV